MSDPERSMPIGGIEASEPERAGRLSSLIELSEKSAEVIVPIVTSLGC